MMSTGLNIMSYGSPMMSPEHNSMPTMNTAEMFDNMWCSSDSGVSGDHSPAQASSPSSNDDQCLWDPGDTSILEANLFNDNINIGFEDDLDLFSFATELGTEDEIEQLSFPDNISEISSSSSTITSHSIPSSPEHFSDHMNSSNFSDNINSSTDSESLNYPSTFKCGNVSAVTALCDNRKGLRGNYNKKRNKSIQDKQRKQPSEEHIDNEGLEGSPKENSDTLKGMNILSTTKKNVSFILDSNVKWSDLGSSDQWCLANGFETVISQSLGVREQLDVKAILKPHNNSSSKQDVHVNNSSLLDDGKLEAVRRYLKSLDGHSNTRPQHRITKNMQKKSRKKSKVDNVSGKDDPGNIFKSNSVNIKEKTKNKEFEKIKSNYNQNKKFKENLNKNKLKNEKGKNYKFIYKSSKFKKEIKEDSPKMALDSKWSNIDVNMTISQPSISWQQRKRPIKPKITYTGDPKTHRSEPKPHREDPKPQSSYAEECQKQKTSQDVCLNKPKGTLTVKLPMDSKKKTDLKTKTQTKKSKNSKQELRSEFLLLKTRSRKEWRQIMKEKRSGLFLQEQVVSLSTTVATNPDVGVNLNLSDQDSDDDVDVDILG